MTIKKIMLSLIALVAAVSAHAQVIDVYVNGQLDATYYNCASKRNKVVFKGNNTEGATATDNCEQVEIYENGTLIKTYNNTTDNVCKVVFRERDYVEIGGVKWATMNVGATSVSDSKATSYGDFYAWGEIEPYYDSLTYDGTNLVASFGAKTKEKTYIKGTKTGYNWSNYCGSEEATEWDPVPYDTSNKTLTAAHDAATYEWGGNWRMPTNAEYQKLRYACTNSEYSKDIIMDSVKNGTITYGWIYKISAGETVDDVTYNVSGVLFVDRNDITKRLFFPCTCWFYGADKYTVDVFRCWISTYSSAKNAYTFGILPRVDNRYFSVTQNLMTNRNFGLPIRPVYRY